MYFIKTIGRNIDRFKWIAYIISYTDAFAGAKKCIYRIKGVGVYMRKGKFET